MKNIKYIVLISIIALISCSKDFLEEDPKTQLTPGSFYKTAEGYRALINGSYSSLRLILNEYEDYLYASDLGTDIWGYGVDGKPINDLYTIDFNGNNTYIKRLWEHCYYALNHANCGVAYGKDVEGIPDDERLVLQAEAYFLRAFYNFMIVQTWGGVHFSLEPVEGVQTEANKTEESIFYDAIIQDLNTAIAYLPETTSDYGRVNKFAAQHLLAQVYLTDVRSTTTEYNLAAQLCDSVIILGGFELLEKRGDVFNFYNQKNNEVIWSVQFTTDKSLVGEHKEGGRMNVFFVSKYDKITGLVRSGEYHRPYSRLMPTKYYLSLFNNEIDSRYEEYFREAYYCNNPTSLLSIGDTALYYPLEEWTEEMKDAVDYKVYDFTDITTSYYPSLTKWDDDPTRTSNANQGVKDHIVYRLAGTHLLAAEAYWRLGNKSKMLEHINIIRQKAAKPGRESDMEIIDYPDDQLLDLLLDERARELGGEQCRWFTLKRLGVLLERVREHRPDTEIQDFHLVRPISIEQIDLCTNVYEQNPGYNL